MPKSFPDIRMPDEVLIQLNSICTNWNELAKLENGDITLEGLNPEQRLALTFFEIHTEISEAFRNIDMSIQDFERLKADPHAFGPNSPMDRFKHIMRMCFYEYARFEDLYGYFTLWLVNIKMIPKDARKGLMQDFHEKAEPIIKGRNTLAHNSTTWKKWTTPELAILEGAHVFDMKVKDKDGNELTWFGQMDPMCNIVIPLWVRLASEMTTTWSMLYAEVVTWLVKEGKLKKAPGPMPFAEHHLRALRRDGVIEPKR